MWQVARGSVPVTDPVRITLGGYQGPGSVHTRGLNLLRDALNRLAGDRLRVTLRPNMAAEGHKTADLPGMVERGEIDGCYVSSSYLADRVPALSLFDMPFAAPDRDGALTAMDGALGRRLAQEIEEGTGLALLGAWDNGIRHMATADRPLRAPSDCAGWCCAPCPMPTTSACSAVSVLSRRWSTPRTCTMPWRGGLSMRRKTR